MRLKLTVSESQHGHELCFAATVLEEAGYAENVVLTTSGGKVFLRINGLKLSEHVAAQEKLSTALEKMQDDLEREGQGGPCLRCARSG